MMNNFDKWLDNRIVQNLIIWLVVFIIFLTSITADNIFTAALFIVGGLAPIIYVNNLFILPYFRTKIALFFLLYFLWILICGFFIFSILQFIDDDSGFNLKLFVNLLGILTLATASGAAIKLAKDSFERKQQVKEAELQLLKGQLNPHFLFNTLNNLYGLSVIKSDKLPHLMLKLSDLLRYSLYDTKASLVPLTKELKYLENYISLEKIRLEDKADIKFKWEGDFSNYQIAPMLFIVFVENAFKYLGITISGDCNVSLTLKAENNSIVFTCINTINRSERIEEVINKNSGIGLNNAKKRLELIYPDNHKLDIVDDSDMYIVTLKINI